MVPIPQKQIVKIHGYTEQVEKVEAYLVANQGSMIESFEGGKTDAISGCTISI